MRTLCLHSCGVILCLARAIHALNGAYVRSEDATRADVIDAVGNVAGARALQEERRKAARRKQLLEELKAEEEEDSRVEMQARQEESEEEQGRQMHKARTDDERELAGSERRAAAEEALIEAFATTEVRLGDNGELEADEAADSVESVDDAARRARILALKKRKRITGREASLEESVTWKRNSQGCRNFKEELYGGLCYKKCPKYLSNSQGGGNAGFSRRVGPNACLKTTCNPASEDEFGGKCYKACADLVKHYTIRKSPTKCGSPEDNVHKTSNAYNTGFGPSNSPIDLIDVAGPSCRGMEIKTQNQIKAGNVNTARSQKKTECCLGYNTNDDDERPTKCPYQPNLGECHETMIGKNDILYRGCQRHTRSGRTCQRWNSQTPHAHSNSATQKPGEGLTSNYCRNPDHDMTIWCYTTDPGKRFEWCDPLTY